MKHSTPINLINVFNGYTYWIYKIYRGFSYLLLIDMIIIFLYPHFMLSYLTVFIVSVIVFGMIFFEIAKKKNKVSLSISENSIMVTDKLSQYILNYEDLAFIEIIFESYRGRSGLFTFWSELGYNQIIVKNKKGELKKFIFQLENEEKYNFLFKRIKIFQQSVVSCNFRIKKRFT